MHLNVTVSWVTCFGLDILVFSSLTVWNDLNAQTLTVDLWPYVFIEGTMLQNHKINLICNNIGGQADAQCLYTMYTMHTFQNWQYHPKTKLPSKNKNMYDISTSPKYCLPQTRCKYTQGYTLIMHVVCKMYALSLHLQTSCTLYELTLMCVQNVCTHSIH
jgi:hypothetical protein